MAERHLSADSTRSDGDAGGHSEGGAPALFAAGDVRSRCGHRRHRRGASGMSEGERPRYDTILVGAGAAGCVLANRLTKILNGLSCCWRPAGLRRRPRRLAARTARPDKRLAGLSQLGIYPRRTTTHNPFPLPAHADRRWHDGGERCVWLRGSAADYDGWAEAGNSGWSFRECCRISSGRRPIPWLVPLAGTNGPVPVFRVADRDIAPAERAFMAAADSLGIPIVADLNGTPNQAPCVGPAPKNIADGIRMNGAFTYLAPARSRRSLAIRANTPVDRVLVENGRATGVRLVDGKVITGREIVLCAGTYGSPAILLRSGIGPRQHLRDLGIPVTQHLPGVGENLLDHPLVSPDRPRPRLVRPEHAPRSRSFIPVLAKARSRHAGNDVDSTSTSGRTSTSHRCVVPVDHGQPAIRPLPGPRSADLRRPHGAARHRPRLSQRPGRS